MTEQVAFSIPQICARNQVGRTRVYEEIKLGRLAVFKVGRATRVTARAEADWHRRLEAETAGTVAEVL